ncbi:MAG TPA: hypothetical protein EYH06_00195 [Chromatiales bacterium]|nr:hypothetical protein [Thiotrichales bacterium]HIP66992.1 hypothetical protein [Chromatiales bacterium]
MHKKFCFIVFILLAVVTAPLFAATVDGVTLPDTVELNGTNLVLNGMGTRKATMFKVKVYVMGLYLTEKRDGAKAIMQSESPKRIVMRFVRDVGAKKIRDGWQTGFEKNSPDAAVLQGKIDQFNAAMDDMKKGDEIQLDFAAGQVDVVINGENKATIEGVDFQRALLSIWLGPHPPNKALKAGILGK